MHHFRALNAIMEEHGWPLGGGSYLINGQNLNYDETTFAKQELLFNTVRDFPTRARVLEIGVYAGHSMLLQLMAQNTSCIDGVDVCFPFTEPCFAYLQANVDWHLFLVKGDSHWFLDDIKDLGPTYDIIHIDGNHSADHIKKDVELCKPLLKESGLIVMDDFDGVSATMLPWIKERFEILKIADCHNPNAILKFK